MAFVGHYFKTEQLGIPGVQVYGTINIHDISIIYHERDYINAKYVDGYMIIYDCVMLNNIRNKNVDIYDFEEETIKSVNLTNS